VIDVKELFVSKLEAIDNIVGLAPDTLNTLAKLGEAINNDSNFYQTLVTDLSFKANAADTYRKDETYTEEEVNQLFEDTTSHLTEALALKEPAFIAVPPMLKVLNSETGNIELKLSPALTDQIDLKLDESQVQTMLDALTDVIDTKADRSDTYTKEQTMDAYEITDKFTLYLAEIEQIRHHLGLYHNSSR
jgi:hypothetical protein